jgi:hypothetical protein
VAEGPTNATCESNFAHCAEFGSRLDAELLGELLACEDYPFIRRAYWVLLGREPDPGGLANYIDRLRGGISRHQVLSELALSPEGQAKASLLPDGALPETHGVPPNGLVDGPSLNGSVKAASVAPVIDNIDELLITQGRIFVACAYQTLLGRDPDPEGLGFYLGQLRAGTCKVEVLAQLRHSAEFKTRAAEVSSWPNGAPMQRLLRRLDWEIIKLRLARLPLIGWTLRAVLGGEADSPTEMRLRRIEYLLASLHPEGETASVPSKVTALATLPASGSEPPTRAQAQGVRATDYALAATPPMLPTASSLRSLPTPRNWAKEKEHA